MSGPLEIAWFSALCDDDYEFLGVPDPALASSWDHCRNIVMRAEEGGFDNILLPSGYVLQSFVNINGPDLNWDYTIEQSTRGD